MNAGQSNVLRNERSRREIGNAVIDEEAQLSVAISTRPPERLTQAAGHTPDPMARRIGLSVVCRSVPRRLDDTPQLKILLEDLPDPSATISEGGGNSEEDIVAANVQRIRRSQKGD